MIRNIYKPLVWLMWLALPITAFEYWPLLIAFYVVLGFLWFGNNSIVEWNLFRQRPRQVVNIDSHESMSDFNDTQTGLS